MVVIMRFSKFLLLGLLLLPAPLLAQAYAPQVDTAAVIRRGNHVEHVNGYQADADVAFGEVTAPPADDSHKWFITVYTIPNCGPCAKLKADWETSEVLRAFAKPKDQAGSWAHLNFYNAEDETVNWRLKNLAVKGYPCIVIQPPRNRQYGDPSTVVMQKSGYKSDKELAAQISASLKGYVKKLEEKKQSSSVIRTAGYGQVAGVNPPFNVPSPNNPNVAPAPLTIPSPLDPDAQPQPTPAPIEPPAEPLPSVQVKRETLTAIVEPDLMSSPERRAGLKRVMDLLRAQHPNAEPRVITLDQAKTEFPQLDTTKQQVVLTGFGGKLITQIPQAILDQLLKDQPELQQVATIVQTVGAILPTHQQLILLAGLAGIAMFFKWRRGRNTPAVPLNPSDPVVADPAIGDGHILRQILEALQARK